MITLDSVSNYAGGSTTTLSHTVTGANAILIAVVGYDKGDGTTALTAISRNGQSFTLAFNIAQGLGGIALGYLVNPTQGTFNISVSYNQSVAVNLITGISYTGVHQVSAVGGSNSNSATGAIDNISTTVTVTGTTGTVVGGFYGQRCSGSTVGSGQTELSETLFASAVNYLLETSYEAHTGSNVTMDITSLTGLSASSEKLIAAIELLPGPAFIPRIQIV